MKGQLRKRKEGETVLQLSVGSIEDVEAPLLTAIAQSTIVVAIVHRQIDIVGAEALPVVIVATVIAALTAIEDVIIATQDVTSTSTRGVPQVTEGAD